MKKSFFCLLTAAGVLALCTTGYAASMAVVAAAPPGETLVLHFQGSERIQIDGAGRLEVLAADGGVRRYRPDVFQTIDGKRKTVTFSVHVIDRDHVELKAIHPNPSAPLELAPVRPKTS